MKNQLLLYLLLSISTLIQVKAQFTLLTDEIRGLRNGDASWTDFDADGDLDLMIFGDDTLANIYTEFYENNDLVFDTFDIDAFPDLMDGSMDWADYDKDGNMDVAFHGFYDEEKWIFIDIISYTNNEFVDTDMSFPDFIYRGEVDWGDYDNDGVDELLVVGQDNDSDSQTKLYSITDGVPVEEGIFDNVSGVSFGSAKWFDYDGDGLLDFIINGATGIAPNTGPDVTKLYRNTGEGGFEEVMEGTFIGLSNGTIDVGDADNDGDPDLLLTGYSNTEVFTGIYINNITDFQLLETNLPNVGEGFAKWGDMDNDGDLDILITGNDRFVNRLTKVYSNDALTFTEVFETIGVVQSAGGWGDFNNDGFLDIYINGQMQNFGMLGAIYLNDGSTAARASRQKQVPVVPQNAHATAGNGSVRIDWDVTTSGTNGSLSYSVQIEKAGEIIIPALSNDDGSRLVPEMGNAGLANFFVATNLEKGDYTYKVQAIDQAFNGSGFVEGTFTITESPDPVLRVDDIASIPMIYPNPVKDGTIYFKDLPKGSAYRIYDSSGRISAEGLISGSLDVSGYSSGGYVIAFPDAKKKVRFVIED